MFNRSPRQRKILVVVTLLALLAPLLAAALTAAPALAATTQGRFETNLHGHLNAMRSAQDRVRLTGTGPLARCHDRVANRAAAHVTGAGRIAFGHIRPSNRCATDRLGYGAARARTAQAAFRELRGKAGTRRALLRRDARALGIGTRRLRNGTWKVVVILGARDRADGTVTRTSRSRPVGAKGRFENALSGQVNQLRSRDRRVPLTRTGPLAGCHDRVANRAALHVTGAGRIAFSHIRPSNRCATDRLGYGAARARTARAAFRALTRDAATRRALRHRAARGIGIGSRRLRDGSWTVVVIIGAGRPSAQPTPTPDQPGSQEPVGDVYPDTVSGQLRGSILGHTNDERTQRGAGRLRTESCLNRNAQRWSQYLAENSFLQHQDTYKIFTECGGRGQIAENLAYNVVPVGSDFVMMWMDSPGHRANLLNSDYTRIGIGATKSDDGHWYAVQVFGTEKW